MPTVTGAPVPPVINGVVQNPTRTYRATVNNFMATDGDGYAVPIGGLNQHGRAQNIDALVA